ncbi:MAG: hypothetical protein GY953_56105, partial [bacterium]|nr:hypothetical protein [bacterium]
LERAIELNPEQAGPFLQLGQLYLTLGDVDGALSQFRIAARFGSPEGHSWAGFALLTGNKPAEAAAEFQQTLDIHRPERQLSGAGIAAEGDVLPNPGKPLSALERAALTATIHRKWLDRSAGGAGVRPLPGVTPTGRASYSAPHLFVAGPGAALYRSTGDGFSDVTQVAGLAGLADVFDSAWAGDDLYLLGGRNRLFRNQGDGTFSDITEQAGLGGSRTTSRAIFFDYDSDSRLDLLEIGSPPRLFHNEGTRWVPAAFPSVEGTITDAVVSDFNQDGRPDIFLLRWRKPALMLLNDGDGAFRDAARALGLTPIAGDRYSAISLDYNQDGRADLFVSAHAPFPEVARSILQPGALGIPAMPKLFRNNDGRFEDVSAEAGLTSVHGTLQAVTADFNSDTLPDILLVNGSLDGRRVEPSVLLRNIEGRTFAEELRLPPASYAGATIADFNRDGSPDLYLAPSSKRLSPLAGPLLLTR